MDEMLEQNMALLVRYYLALNFPRPRVGLRDFVRAMEKQTMREMLRLTRGRQKQAAQLLGLMETTFCEKLKRYGIREELRGLPPAGAAAPGPRA